MGLWAAGLFAICAILHDVTFGPVTGKLVFVTGDSQLISLLLLPLLLLLLIRLDSPLEGNENACTAQSWSGFSPCSSSSCEKRPRA